MGIWHHRYALWNLVKKDFRVRYRNMALGFLWSIINPLVMLGVLVFVFSYVLKLQREPYHPVILLTGLVLYNFFSLCLSTATTSIQDNAAVVKKIIFPRIIIPVSVVLSQIIHLLLSFIVVTIFMICFNVPLSSHLYWLPVILMVLTVFIIGMALIVSSLNVFFRDIRYIVESGLAVLFWFTPIFYPLSMAHENLPKPVYFVAILNPLAGCISSARNVLIRGIPPDQISFTMAAVMAVVVLLLGQYIFRKVQNHFADYI